MTRRESAGERERYERGRQRGAKIRGARSVDAMLLMLRHAMLLPLPPTLPLMLPRYFSPRFDYAVTRYYYQRCYWYALIFSVIFRYYCFRIMLTLLILPMIDFSLLIYDYWCRLFFISTYVDFFFDFISADCRHCFSTLLLLDIDHFSWFSRHFHVAAFIISLSFDFRLSCFVFAISAMPYFVDFRFIDDYYWYLLPLQRLSITLTRCWCHAFSPVYAYFLSPLLMLYFDFRLFSPLITLSFSFRAFSIDMPCRHMPASAYIHTAPPLFISLHDKCTQWEITFTVTVTATLHVNVIFAATPAAIAAAFMPIAALMLSIGFFLSITMPFLRYAMLPLRWYSPPLLHDFWHFLRRFDFFADFPPIDAITYASMLYFSLLIAYFAPLRCFISIDAVAAFAVSWFDCRHATSYLMPRLLSLMPLHCFDWLPRDTHTSPHTYMKNIRHSRINVYNRIMAFDGITDSLTVNSIALDYATPLFWYYAFRRAMPSPCHTLLLLMPCHLTFSLIDIDFLLHDFLPSRLFQILILPRLRLRRWWFCFYARLLICRGCWWLPLIVFSRAKSVNDVLLRCW